MEIIITVIGFILLLTLLDAKNNRMAALTGSLVVLIWFLHIPFKSTETITHTNVMSHDETTYSEPQTFIQTRVITPSLFVMGNSDVWTLVPAK